MQLSRTVTLANAHCYHQVLDVHTAFLSNYEVLALLKDNVKAQEKLLKDFQDSVPHKLRSPTYSAVKGEPYLDYDQALGRIVPDNVRTLQVEVRLELSIADLRFEAHGIRKDSGISVSTRFAMYKTNS